MEYTGTVTVHMDRQRCGHVGMYCWMSTLRLTPTTVSPSEFCMTPHTGTATPRSPHLDIPQTVQGQQEPPESGRTPSYLVISGGTGCNAICAAFALNACYVLPVSDNGGSSSEIIRVLGGPSIGKPFFFRPHRSMYCTERGHHESHPHHWRPTLTAR